MRRDAPASAQADACKAEDQEFYHVLSPYKVSNVETDNVLLVVFNELSTFDFKG